jgi:2,4-dienoyl-CoA reductase-like NADH-dependent reductase (Old Yellow Enzyme family)
MNTTDVATIFEPLRFRTLEVKNRVFRSSLAGRFNNYDGTGNQAHVNWDLKFARGGVGAIISSNAPVHPRGLIVPNYAHIDRDETVPFWREVVRRVHEHDCRYIVQLAFSGRQRDLGGIQFEKGWSSTDKPEPIHGLRCERMSVDDIRELVDCFAQAARRAREAGADGIEVHGCNGYLITQFLSPAANDRKDDYGGSLENRVRFALEIVRAIRAEVGEDYHLQFKITAVDYGKDLFPWAARGTTLEESVQVCKWLEEAGVDAFHVSSGNSFRTRATPRVGSRYMTPCGVRHDDLERPAHLPTTSLQVLAVQPRVQVGLGGREGSRGGHQPRRLPGDREASRFPWCTGDSRPHPWPLRPSPAATATGSRSPPLIANPTSWDGAATTAVAPCTYTGTSV